jgi:hypothetical protein
MLDMSERRRGSVIALSRNEGSVHVERSWASDLVDALNAFNGRDSGGDAE